ncbi:MAG: transketolase [Lentisphaerae bacterium]|nr:transketolase [Lentisphaerota bacterium]
MVELRGFKVETLSTAHLAALTAFTRRARGDILKMTTSAGSGHPGGALSSVDIYTILWHAANVAPQTSNDPGRDIILASHGHTAAAIYAVMGRLGYYDISEIHSTFRQLDSCFDGLPNHHLPGIEWCCGSLGQGLSAACGYALAARMQKINRRVFVVMGDGEQQKGQMTEAAEFAAKLGLSNLTAVVDFNGLQASGATSDVMPQQLAAKYEAAGWEVARINGHDLQEIYQALRAPAVAVTGPRLILAETVMGKGVSFIENRFEYHGAVLKDDMYRQALTELGVDDDDLHSSVPVACAAGETPPVETRVQYGSPIEYGIAQAMDNRSAFGAALLDVVKANSGPDAAPIAVLDCDLSPSVRTQAVADQFPEHFIQCGIQEHNATTVGGALAKAGVLTFFAEFGVFGLDETYGQHRILDLNDVGFKQICTHCGLDVGEDGKTHQCIDYISLAANLLSYRLILPADANQTDRAIRYVATTPGNFIVAMGRSKLPSLVDADGQLMYPANYRFEYGRADWPARGKDGVIVTHGTMVHRAMQARTKLVQHGLDIGVLNVSCPLDLDVAAIAEAAATGLIVSYEDHNVRTGLGALLGAHLAEHGLHCKFRRMGIQRLGCSGSPDDQYKLHKLDVDSVANTVLNHFGKHQ